MLQSAPRRRLSDRKRSASLMMALRRRAGRPRNAAAQGGVTSLPRAHDGNGASEFKQAIPTTRGPATTLADRGANAPKARYMTTSAFETIALCLTDKRGNCAIATGGDQGRLSAPKRSQ